MTWMLETLGTDDKSPPERAIKLSRLYDHEPDVDEIEAQCGQTTGAFRIAYAAWPAERAKVVTKRELAR